MEEMKQKRPGLKWALRILYFGVGTALGAWVAYAYLVLPARGQVGTTEKPPAAEVAPPVSEVPAEPVVSLAPQKPAAFWPIEVTAHDGPWTGRLVRIHEHLALLTVRGTPVQRGAAHGHLLKEKVQLLVSSVRKHLRGTHADPSKRDAQYAQCLDGARVMKRYLDAGVWEELEACAAAAEVNADELLLAQLFGDVNRAKGFAMFCSSFAAFGPATKDGDLVFGRNFDYAGHGLEGGLPLVLQEIPLDETGAVDGRPFVTIGYAGILNGWTAMNADGLCASNNTLFGGKDALEGISTCFLLRKIVERGRTVEAGVKIVEDGPRACTTGMLIAGKNAAGAWDARLVEFDHKNTAVLAPVDGKVMGTNSRQALPYDGLAPSGNPACTRYQKMKQMLSAWQGTLRFGDPAMNPVALESVFMSINLHCALLDPVRQRVRVAVEFGDGKPAGRNEFFEIQVHPDRLTWTARYPSLAP